MCSRTFAIVRADNWSNILYSVVFPVVAGELQRGLRVQRNVRWLLLHHLLLQQVLKREADSIHRP